jgi:putative transposase
VNCFKFIEAEKAEYPVSLLCRVLKVSRSSYYAYKDREPSDRARADATLMWHIHRVHRDSRGTYGAPRVHAELRATGIRCARKRVARLMREANIFGCGRGTRRRSTTEKSSHSTPAADLVKRNFSPEGKDRLWVADITYLPSWSGWLYLAFVLDAYSRRVVGWSMANRLRSELVVDALNMALWRRGPSPGVVHHSDRGSQYTSVEFSKRLEEAGVLPSMGSVADPYDNALAESFVASLKCELLHRSSWPTRESVRVAVFEYIESFYNPRRRHSALGYLSPMEYEEVRIGEAVAA